MLVSLVEVCWTLPLLVQRTVVPTFIVKLSGSNEKSTILSSTVTGGQVAVGMGVLVAVLVRVLVTGRGVYVLVAVFVGNGVPHGGSVNTICSPVLRLAVLHE